MPPLLAFHLTASHMLEKAGLRGDALKRAGITAVVCESEIVESALAFLDGDPALPLIGIGAEIDVRGDAEAPSLIAALDRAEAAGGPPMLLLRLRSSDPHDLPSAPRAMPHAADIVARLAKYAAALGVNIALEHRAGMWMSRIEDAVRVAMRVNHPNLGVAFSYADWSATENDPVLLPDRLKLAMPKLLAVTVPLGKMDSDGASRPIVEHLIGTPALMRELQTMGYTGPVVLRPVESIVPAAD